MTEAQSIDVTTICHRVAWAGTVEAVLSLLLDAMDRFGFQL